MKKFTQLLMLSALVAFLVGSAQAQETVLYESGFDDYTVGQMVALDDPTGFWTTWSDDPGGDEDAFIVDDESASPDNSAKVDGLTDLLFLMGDKKTGKYQLNFKYFVPAGYGGYYNIQHFEEAGKEYAYDVFFSAAEGENNGYIEAVDPDPVSFTYTHDSWVQIENIFDLDNDMVEVWIEGVLVLDAQFSNPTLQLGAADIWAGAPDIDIPLYYLDDVEFIELVPSIQEPILEVTGQFPIFVNIEQWQEVTESFEVGNLGEADLNYDVVVSYPTEEVKKPIQQTPSKISGKKTGNNQNIADPEASPAAINPASPQEEVVLNYDGDNYSAIGQPADYEYIVAALFPADMLQPYIGLSIDQVDVYVNDQAYNTKVQIFGMGPYPGVPGDLLYEQNFEGLDGQWNTIMLDEPFFIDGSDITVGWFLFGIGDTFVPGCDEGPANPNGNWMSTNGGSWTHLVSTLDYNWNIRAYANGEPIKQWISVSPAEGTLASNETQQIDVTINTDELDAVAYHGMVTVRSNDEEAGNYEIDVYANVTVGVNEFGEQVYVAVYPNPAKDLLMVKSNGDLQNVRIMNNIGQIVFDQQAGVSNMQINISNFEAGVYFIQVETESGSSTQKIVIK